MTLTANIVLCGFMGTGKTAVGRRLAAMLGREFVDLDAEIAARYGGTVAEIFAAEGEAGFRRREREIVVERAPASGAVLATGGGVLLDPANHRDLKAGGELILLTASAKVLARRLAGDRSRPLLDHDGDLAGHIAGLLAEREAIYAPITRRIDTGERSPTELALAIAQEIPLELATTEIAVVGAEGQAPLAARELRATRVVTGHGACVRLGEELRDRGVTGQVVLAMPPVVRDHYAPRLEASLRAAGLPTSSLTLPDGDAEKTFGAATRLVDELAALGCDRDSCVVAAGGGVTGDLAGFAAAIYMRGIALAMVPTTLLAMVDAHLGGKTGVNTPRAKNLAGAFHPPLLVVADPVVLGTLPDRELACGYAEVVKTALIDDAALFARLGSALIEPAAGGDPRRDPELLDTCVAACARVKGGVVTRDPWELGERRVLNLGHTVGHALEAQRELGLAHGEAVSLGLLVALRLSVQRGVLAGEVLDRTRRLLAACGLPITIPDVAHDRIRDRLRLDKKRRGDLLRFVLCREAGQVEVVDDVTDDEALAALTEEQRCASS
jgi:shikimate kinase/3-dehydroquinate synthase